MVLKLIDLDRTARNRGRQHGEEMKAHISASVEAWTGIFGGRGASRGAVIEEASAWYAFLRKTDPDYVDEVEGIADAANVSAEQVVMLNVRHEIGFRLLARQAIKLSNAAMDGCTSVGLLPEATSIKSTILAQNIDGMAAMRGAMFVGRTRSIDQPESIALFEPGCVGPSAGLNEVGIGFVYNSLLTMTDGCGPMRAPFRARTRSILRARTFEAALRAVVHADRNCSINYLIGHSDGEIIEVEAAPGAKTCLYPKDGIITHANHFEHTGAVASEWERFLPDSLFRSRRLERHLRRDLGNIEPRHIVEGLKDHFSYPSSICLHPDCQNPNARQATTLVAVVVDLTRRELLATDGPPCEAPLQCFELTA